MLIKNKNIKSFKNKEQFRIGKMAIKGGQVSKIALSEGKSRKYVYEQKNKLEAEIDKIGEKITEYNTITLKIDDAQLKRIIIGLALFCSSGIEGIQTFTEEIFKLHVSIGKISEIINDAAEKAKEFDKTIKLNRIEVGANDEIFQCNEPVLVGVDPVSTYTFLMEPANDRTAQTWANAFEEQKKAGLLLKTSVNDAGAGLNKGLKLAFPELEIQADTFHAIHPIGKAIASLEKKANHAIKEEAVLEEKCKNPKAQNRTWDKLEKAQASVEEAVQKYDIAYILYMWLCELLGVTGYSPDDTKKLIAYITKELSLLCDSKCMENGIRFINENIDQLLLYATTLEQRIKNIDGIDVAVQVGELILRQMSYGYESIEYNLIEAEIGELLGSHYEEVKAACNEILSTTVRASSIVENVNGRLRVYMNLKRVIPNNFFPLLKVYFNTKKYKRSRIKERIGKSPLDMLTGKDNPGLFELLGY